MQTLLDIQVRALTAGDAPAVEAMAARCSTGALRRRLPGGLRDVERFLVAPLLTGLPAERHDIGALTGNLLVGIASLVRMGNGQWEAAMLVEDRHQHRGVGHQLACALVEQALQVEAAGVIIEYDVSNTAVDRLIRHYGADLDPARACDGTVRRLVLPRMDLH